MAELKSFLPELFSIRKKNMIGEKSIKTGTEFEKIASYLILTKFPKIFKRKNKIRSVYFNTIEDLDLIDESGRMICIQIKKAQMTWRKSNEHIYNFINSSLQIFVELTAKAIPVENVLFIFFTNITGDFFINWDKLLKDDFDGFLKNLPSQVRAKINELNIQKKELRSYFDQILFFDRFPEQDYNAIKNRRTGTFSRFMKILNKIEPMKEFDYAKILNFLYKKIREGKYKIFQPEIGSDEIIINHIRIASLPEVIYMAGCSDLFSRGQIRNELIMKGVDVPFIIKEGYLYTCLEYNDRNPLTDYIRTPPEIKTVRFGEVCQDYIVEFLNSWIEKYLNDLGVCSKKDGNSIFFYFSSDNDEKILRWKDPYTIRKEYRTEAVITHSRGQRYFYHYGAEIFVRCYDSQFFIVILPRVVFTKDGKTLLPSQRRRELERSYRKAFNKNDFLLKRFLMWRAVLKKEFVGEKARYEFLEIMNPITRVQNKIKVRIRFLDGSGIQIEDPLKITAAFRPNDDEIPDPDQMSLDRIL